MKKFTLILLVLFYGLSSSGTTINLHFCCGKLDGVSLNNRQHQQDCPMGKKAGNTKCCHDQQLSVKVQADQQPVAKHYQAQHIAIVAAPAYSVFASNPPPAALFVSKVTNCPFSPPLPVYLIHRVFRI